MVYEAIIQYKPSAYSSACGCVLPATWYGEIDVPVGYLYEYADSKAELVSLLIGQLKQRGLCGTLKVISL